MSRWAEMFAALSEGSDTVDTLRHNTEPASRVSHSVQSVTPSPKPTTAPSEALSASRGEVEEERTATALGEPVLLRDGRRLWRFPAGAVPDRAPSLAETLITEARWSGAVLVADGSELSVVERWLSTVPPQTLGQLRGRAGEIIAALRRQSRARDAR